MNLSEQPAHGWELVREFGLEYTDDAHAAAPVDLKWPTVAERLASGVTLVVDEYPLNTAAPRTDCRTYLLSDALEVLYSSKAEGIEDAYGCAMRGGEFAILCRMRREILVLSDTGRQIRRIGLPQVSEAGPKFLTWTPQGTFLVNFFARGRNADIAELDMDGRLRWQLAGANAPIGMPGSMQLLPDDSILIANEINHVVQQVRRNGSVSIRWGRWNLPSAAHGHLSMPKWARLLEDGTLLVADSHNHRCLSIRPGGSVSEVLAGDRSLFVPACVNRMENGGHLICDAAMRCIFEVDRTGRILRQVGNAIARKRHFSFPRSVQHLGGANYLVADTAHNRIAGFDGLSLRSVPFGDERALYWPRAVRQTSEGNLLVADSRNSRVLELGPDGRTLNQLQEVTHRGRRIELQDPHDVRPLPGKRLLITDSAHGIVLETGWDGRAGWVIGHDGDLVLDDPHGAQIAPDGRVAIADSGNHRILLVDPATGAREALAMLATDAVDGKLNYPRYLEIGRDGSMLIVDSHNSRLVAVDRDGSFLWEFSRVPGSPIASLYHPRWAHRSGRDDIVISDFFNHRVLHLRRGSSTARGLRARRHARSFERTPVLATGLSFARMSTPKVSIVVVGFNMARELPRTIQSLSPHMQRGIDVQDYEVILVDNGSSVPIDEAALRRWIPNLAVHRMPDATVSPVPAINLGLEMARADLVGAFIDGARMASSGLLATALRASRLHRRPIVGTIAFHLGPEVQMKSVKRGYDQAAEDRLLAGIRWEEDGYRLFEISSFAGSSERGWFQVPGESNAVFLRAGHWRDLGGYDRGFVSPGGGLANLDLWVRACTDRSAELIMLLGEATFHQVHGGVSTNAMISPWPVFEQEYIRLRGQTYAPPDRRAIFYGTFPDSAKASLKQSAR